MERAAVGSGIYAAHAQGVVNDLTKLSDDLMFKHADGYDTVVSPRDGNDELAVTRDYYPDWWLKQLTSFIHGPPPVPSKEEAAKAKAGEASFWSDEAAKAPVHAIGKLSATDVFGAAARPEHATRKQLSAKDFFSERERDFWSREQAK